MPTIRTHGEKGGTGVSLDSLRKKREPRGVPRVRSSIAACAVAVSAGCPQVRGVVRAAVSAGDDVVGGRRSVSAAVELELADPAVSLEDELGDAGPPWAEPVEDAASLSVTPTGVVLLAGGAAGVAGGGLPAV